MKYGNVIFRGKSGQSYRFEAWSLETKFKPLAGVYFVTRRGNEDSNYNRATHEHVYIGHAASLAEPLGNPSQLDLFRKHGANCVCVYAADGEERRIAIEQDLLAAYPTSCNRPGERRDILWFDIKQSEAGAGPEAAVKAT